MINNLYNYTNPFNIASCVKYICSNLVWWISQIIIVVLTVLLFLFVSVEIFKKISPGVNKRSHWDMNKDLFLILWVLSYVLNLVIFELLYSPFYRFFSSIFLSLMNILSLAIFAFIYKLNNLYIQSISEFLLLMAFPIVHAIIVYKGNGVPKIVCKLDSNGNLIAESIDLKRAKDGVYCYDFQKDIVWLFKEATTKGTCIELHVKNERIDKCRFFLDGNQIDNISYKDNKKLCGFDANGLPLIA